MLLSYGYDMTKILWRCMMCLVLRQLVTALLLLILYIVISYFICTLCLILANINDDICKMRDSLSSCLYIRLGITFTVSTGYQWCLYYIFATGRSRTNSCCIVILQNVL